jgi:ribonucleoside-triphosphate reductase
MIALQSIDKQIAEKKAQLENIKGTETEVYTRIVGYYRQVKNFNKGQDAQRKQRKYFKIEGER